MKTKDKVKKFEFIHPVSGDVFTYEDSKHAYKLNKQDLPGTTTPLELVNELSWDDKGKMSSKSQIIQKWAVNKVADKIIKDGKELIDYQNHGEYVFTTGELEKLVLGSKSAPYDDFKSAGVSGTEIHNKIEWLIKDAISKWNGQIPYGNDNLPKDTPKQVHNFVYWAGCNNVKFLYAEEPIYSKEWMNCGTVDFVCEIDGKTLVGDIKTNGNKRRYYWDGKKYDFKRPVSDIHTNALFQCGAYAKMCVEDEARKLVDKVDGVVVVNIKKSGVFDEKIDVRYDYNLDSLIKAYDYVINLYKIYRNK